MHQLNLCQTVIFTLFKCWLQSVGNYPPYMYKRNDPTPAHEPHEQASSGTQKGCQTTGIKIKLHGTIEKRK